MRVDGVSTFGVDFWHAVEFSRYGRFLQVAFTPTLRAFAFFVVQLSRSVSAGRTSRISFPAALAANFSAVVRKLIRLSDPLSRPASLCDSANSIHPAFLPDSVLDFDCPRGRGVRDYSPAMRLVQSQATVRTYPASGGPSTALLGGVSSCSSSMPGAASRTSPARWTTRSSPVPRSATR